MTITNDELTREGGSDLLFTRVGKKLALPSHGEAASGVFGAILYPRRAIHPGALVVRSWLSKQKTAGSSSR